jgi:hypothetical protein
LFCDDLRAVAAGTEQINKNALRGFNPAMFNPTNQNLNTSLATSAPTDEHGSKECQTCHRKLTPLSKRFAGANGVDKNFPFVFDDFLQGQQTINGSSTPEQIFSSDAYLSCQVKRVWSWYMGEDLPLRLSTFERLKTVFRETGGNFSALAKEVVTQPEFSNPIYANSKRTFDGVKPIMQRCQSCHEKEPLLADFTAMPFVVSPTNTEADKAEHFEWIQKILKSTKLHQSGFGRTMPPAKANWELSDRDRMFLGQWIWDGARDEKGSPTLDQGQIKALLEQSSDDFKSTLTDRTPKATFANTYRRYLRGWQFAQRINDLVAPSGLITGDGLLMGKWNPTTGSPTKMTLGDDDLAILLSSYNVPALFRSKLAKESANALVASTFLRAAGLDPAGAKEKLHQVYEKLMGKGVVPESVLQNWIEEDLAALGSKNPRVMDC